MIFFYYWKIGRCFEMLTIMFGNCQILFMFNTLFVLAPSFAFTNTSKIHNNKTLEFKCCENFLLGKACLVNKLGRLIRKACF